MRPSALETLRRGPASTVGPASTAGPASPVTRARRHGLLVPATALLCAAVAGTAGTAVAVDAASHPGRPQHAAAAGRSPGAPARPAASAAATQNPQQGDTLSGAMSIAGPTATPGTARSLDGRTAAPARVHVAPLRHLYTPDVMVRVDRPLMPAQLARLRATPGVQAVTVLDWGKVRTPAGVLTAVGVDPSQFRQLAPRLTAQSDALWRAIAEGSMAVSFSRSTALKKQFGREMAVSPLRRGARTAKTDAVRLGAFATLGLPLTDAVVSHDEAMALGLADRRELVLAAPTLGIEQVDGIVRDVLGRTVRLRELRPQPVNQMLISSYALNVIPPAYLKLYREAATTCPGLPWTVLAAIGAVETNHGHNVAVSSAGAMGPMQFLPSTFREYGVDANGDGTADINDPVDAIFSAARYLCLSGAGLGGQSLYDAVFAYNHADWYVREVLALAIQYQ